jgi:ATP-dependent Lon protease
MSQYIEKAEKLTLPVVPLSDAVAFPPFPFDYETDDIRACAAIDAAASTAMLVFLVGEKPDAADVEFPGGLYTVGTVARIRQTMKSGEGVHFICECLSRATVIDYRRAGKLISVCVMSKEISLADGGGVRGEAYCRELVASLDKMLTYVGKSGSTIKDEVVKIHDPGIIADLIASTVLVKTTDKQAVLEEYDPFRRAALLLRIMEEELDLILCEQEITL